MRPRRPSTDPYALLGVDPGASRAEIRRAYRRRALAIHPDVAGVEATTDMADLNGARDVVLERTRPRGHDRPTGASGASKTDDTPHREPRAPAYGTTWADYWSSWNDLPRREGSSGS